MLINKPSYTPSTKTYSCDIKDGFRFSSCKGLGVNHEVKWLPELQEVANGYRHSSAFVDSIVALTKGWFSKPLTPEYLQPKIQIDIAMDEISDDFEGDLTWQAERLIISKDSFRFVCPLIEKKPVPPVLIEFPDDLPANEPTEIPLTDLETTSEESQLPLGIGPTRQQIHKKVVLEARTKAARALFHAERLTQEYVATYGEDTDWEDEE